MRPLEILLSLVNLAAFLYLTVAPLRAARWPGYAVPAAVGLSAAQALVEGPRWQMIPAYALSAVFFVVWLLWGRGPAGAGSLNAWAARLGIGLGALLLIVSSALPVLLPVFRIPRPTGRYDIGTLTYHWVDAHRGDVFTDDPYDRREVMVQVWYPAEAAPSAPHAAYIDDPRIPGPVARMVGLPAFTFAHFAYVETNAVPYAPVSDGQHTFPVLIFSHGRGGFRTHNTMQIEELASYGYIVVAIDSSHAASAVVFPDGRVVPFDQRLFDPEHIGHAAFLDEVLPFLAQDVSFTLDQLAALNQADPNGILTGRLALEHAAAFGVSLGGIITAEACHLDARLQACLSMDAFVPTDAVEPGLQQPLLIMSRDASDMQAEHWAKEDIDETQTTIRAAFDNLKSDGYLVWIDGIYHNDFSDIRLYTPLASQLGLTGPIDPLQARRIYNAYALAFFDRHLKGLPAPLLDGPAVQFPEVTLETRHPEP